MHYAWSSGWVAHGDCLEGMNAIGDGTIDLVFADPPFGINFDRKGAEYKRDNSNVVPGYVEVRAEDYVEFSERWIRESARLLRPGGTLWAVSGWTHSHTVHRAILNAGFELVNKVVWHYNFGVHTHHKFVTCFYEMFYAVKPPLKHRTFNNLLIVKKDDYHDRQAVWKINRQYMPGKAKNATKLPDALVEKVLKHVTNPGDLVLDPFAGNATTALMCLKLGRRSINFENNPNAYEVIVQRIEEALNA